MDRETMLKTIKISLISILIVAIIVLIVFQTRKIATGPEIYIKYPENGQNIITRSILISGNIKNAIETKINDRPFYIEENGDFKEIYVLSDGLNRIKIYGKDRLEKEASTILSVIYSGESTNFDSQNTSANTLSAPSSTTTPSSSQKSMKGTTTSVINGSTTSPIRVKRF